MFHSSVWHGGPEAGRCARPYKPVDESYVIIVIDLKTNIILLLGTAYIIL